jgi:hypothetical protein
MTVSSQTIRVSYTGDGTTTAFTVPFLFYANTDLEVFTNGAQVSTGFSVTGAGIGSGTITFSQPPSAGVNIQCILSPPITQLVNLVDGTAFPSATLNQVNDRAIQIDLRLQDQISRSIVAPDGDVSPQFGLPKASVRAGGFLTFDANGNLAVSQTLPPGTVLNAAAVGALIYPQTAQEAANNIVPSVPWWPPGRPERYGAVADGKTDDTVAVQAAITGSNIVTLSAGKIYAVTSVTISNAFTRYYGNGGVLAGISATAKSAVVQILTSYAAYYDLVTSTNLGTVVPNPNYTCSVWFGAATGNYQWNKFYGLFMTSATRGLVIGALPGNTPDANSLISENQWYGFGTVGVQNPFYHNCTQGFAWFSNPVFYSGSENWTGTFSQSAARAIENVLGAMFCQGGEIEFPYNSGAYAASIKSAILIGMYIEKNVPFYLTGDGLSMSDCLIYDLVPGASSITLASGATGFCKIEGCEFQRPSTPPPGVGSYDGTSMIDASVAGAFTVSLSGCITKEWSWNTVNGNTRLVKTTDGNGTLVRYRDHIMQKTAQAAFDTNIYAFDSPGDSMLDGSTFDRLGYSTTGWELVIVNGGGTTMTNTTAAGPTGYNAKQIQLLATGNYSVISPSTHIPCAPGELFWVSCWINTISGGNGKLVLRCFDTSNTEIFSAGQPAIILADSGSIPANTWTFCESPSGSLPTGTAYVAPAIYGNTSTVIATDMRIRHADADNQ